MAQGAEAGRFNYLVLRALLHLYAYYGDDFTVECPTGSGLDASHQTGWTGLVARVIQVRGYLRPEDVLSSAMRGNLVYRGATT